MEWFIIGRDMHVLCNPSSGAPDSLFIDDSGSNLGQEIVIVNNVATGTYDFMTDPDHPDSQYITEGNYISFKDKYGKDRLYTIMTIEGDEEWTVHCEDVGLDLINEDTDAWDIPAEPIEKTLNRVLYDTGWEIGINEIPDRSRATKYEGITDSQLARVGMICNTFECECDFEIVMQGSKVTKQVVNIYKALGEDMTQQRFIDDINLIALRRSGSIEDLCTCLRCYGKENSETGVRLSIADIVYNDGRYFTIKGNPRIFDREARDKWSRFRAYYYEGDTSGGGYINGTFEYDTDSAQELFNRGLANLKTRNEKKVSYEATLYDLQADIGDMVQIADNRHLEKIYLSARVQSVRNHYTVQGEDTGVLANYTLLESNPAKSVEDLMKELKDKIVDIKGAEVSYRVGASGTEIPAGTWTATIPSVPAGQYLWTKTVTNYSDGSSTTAYSVSKAGEDGPAGAAGTDGNGVKSTTVTYQSSAGGTTAPTGAWSTAIPAVTAGNYLWTRTITTYDDGSTTTAYSVAKMGDTGEKGTSAVNLLPNSTWNLGQGNWVFSASNFEILWPEADKPNSCILHGKATTSSSQQAYNMPHPIWVDAGKTYTVAFDYRETGYTASKNIITVRVFETPTIANSQANSLWYLYRTHGNLGITSNVTDFTRYNFEITPTASGYMDVIPYDADVTGNHESWFREIMVVEGTKEQMPSTWLPNVEDLTGPAGADGADGKMLYATSSTAAATVAKVATLSAGTLVLTAGATVAVKFTYANTAASPTLNVNSTGAKAIYTQGVPYAYWTENATVILTYDGTYWRVASQPVYASTATVGNSAGYNVYIDSSSVNVRQGNTVLAAFGAGTIVLGEDKTVYINEGAYNAETPIGGSTSIKQKVSIDGLAVRVKLGSGSVFDSILFGDNGSVSIPNLQELGTKAPTSHASTATTYGVGTTANYGHCRVINNLTTAAHTNGYALSAYQGKVMKDGHRYLTSEVMTNETWVDGRPIYTKTFNVGAISSANKTIAHGIANIGTFRAVDSAHSYVTTSGNYYAFPRVATSTSASTPKAHQTVSASISATSLIVESGSDANFTGCYVTIKYTKTTD